MPSDQTPYFKAYVKTLKSQAQVPGDENGSNKQDYSKTSLAYKRMVAQALSLGRDLVEFQQVVLSQRCEYLSFNSFRSMSDSERDSFDRDTEKVLQQLSNTIRHFCTQTAGDLIVGRDEKKHLSVVAVSLDTHLKRVAKMLTDMRAIRLRNAAKRREVLRLYNLVEARQKRHEEQERKASEENSALLYSSGSQSEIRRRRRRNSPDEQNDSGEKFPVIAKSHEILTGSSKSEIDIHRLDSRYEEDIDSRITSEERVQLTAENERLFDRFSHMHSQIEVLETQIAEIQRLQETFAEKIMDQEKDIEIINEAALHASENLRDGNEWIRQAISNSAGRRVVVLFCIIVITFTLLFIDWYNP